MNVVMRIYRKLLANPGDAQVMQVLADALLDRGEDELALAYRWAAANKKWPFQRHRRQGYVFPGRLVYDWDTDNRQSVEESARLPQAMHHMINTEFLMGTFPAGNHRHHFHGGVHRAFRLLAKVLLKYLQQNPSKVGV